MSSNPSAPACSSTISSAGLVPLISSNLKFINIISNQLIYQIGLPSYSLWIPFKNVWSWVFWFLQCQSSNLSLLEWDHPASIRISIHLPKNFTVSTRSPPLRLFSRGYHTPDRNASYIKVIFSWNLYIPYMSGPISLCAISVSNVHSLIGISAQSCYI